MDMVLKNASILIVDDEPDVLTAVRLLLKTEVKDVVTEKIRRIYAGIFQRTTLM